jgi:hypothetical protein
MPQGSQRAEYDQNYGRYIPEIEAEEVRAETGQGPPSRAGEKAGRSRQTIRATKELTVGQRLSLMVRKQERQILSTKSPAPRRHTHRRARTFSQRAPDSGLMLRANAAWSRSRFTTVRQARGSPRARKRSSLPTLSGSG